MRIDRELNLVLPINLGDADGYVHSMPISRAAFEGSYKIIAAAYSEIWSGGAEQAFRAGPRIAALEIKEAGKTLAIKRGLVDEAGNARSDGGALALMQEIQRLSNIIAPTENGWEVLPVNVAIGRNIISKSDWEEVENSLAFFTLVSAMTEKARLEAFWQMVAPMVSFQIVSQNCTEYSQSLPTSMLVPALPGAVASSVPS
jgi:hypothetical protein